MSCLAIVARCTQIGSFLRYPSTLCFFDLQRLSLSENAEITQLIVEYSSLRLRKFSL